MVYVEVKPTNVSMRRLHAAAVLEVGWCTACKDFTTTNVEVEMLGAHCVKCNRDTVFGAIQALEQGVICVP